MGNEKGMYEIRVTGDFAAAHRLRLVGRKCENLHGHNYKVQACVEGEQLDDIGVLMDFGILKKHLKEILEHLDHKFLNDLECFQDDKVSSENIATYIGQELKGRIDSPSYRIKQVTVWETDDACAVYKL